MAFEANAGQADPRVRFTTRGDGYDLFLTDADAVLMLRPSPSVGTAPFPDLALHGHAHAGTEAGMTPGGVPVRNVAQQVMKRPYNVYCFAERRLSPVG